MADLLISPFNNISYGEPAILSEKNPVSGKTEKFLSWPEILDYFVTNEPLDPKKMKLYAPFAAKDYDIHRYIARVFLGAIETTTEFEQDKKGNATQVHFEVVGDYEDHEQTFEKIALRFASEYGDFMARDPIDRRPTRNAKGNLVTGAYVNFPRLRSMFYEWERISYAVLKKSVKCTDDLVDDIKIKNIAGKTAARSDSLIKRKIKQHTSGDIQVKRTETFNALLPDSLAGYSWALMARELTAGVEYEACSRRYETACERRSDEPMCQCTLPSSAPTFQSGNRIIHCCDRCRWADTKRKRASDILFEGTKLGTPEQRAAGALLFEGTKLGTPEQRAAGALLFGEKGTKKPSK